MLKNLKVRNGNARDVLFCKRQQRNSTRQSLFFSSPQTQTNTHKKLAKWAVENDRQDVNGLYDPGHYLQHTVAPILGYGPGHASFRRKSPKENKKNLIWN